MVESTRFRLVPQALVSLRSKVLQLGRSSRQLPVADNVVGWLGTTGILAALRRRAIEGGSYRVVVSLTRTVLWLLSLGIFEKAYAKSTAGSTDEHTEIARRSCLVGHARRGSTTKPTDSLKFGR